MEKQKKKGSRENLPPMYSKALYYNICFVRKEKRRCREHLAHFLGGLRAEKINKSKHLLKYKKRRTVVLSSTPLAVGYRFCQYYILKILVCQHQNKRADSLPFMYYLKYLFKSPSNALPCLASSHPTIQLRGKARG